MKLKEIKEVLDAEVIVASDLELEIKMCCGADLMSDVLIFIKSGALLLTGLVNSQVIRTAEVADIKIICFVRGKRPSPEIIEMAKEKDMGILTTNFPMYEACGRLYNKGLHGCSG